MGGRAEGLNSPDFPLHLVTVEDVIVPYNNTLRFFGILSAKQLQDKIAHCAVTPATWMILFQDKVHAVFRDRDGGPLVDTGQGDPVAMTIADAVKLIQSNHNELLSADEVAKMCGMGKTSFLKLANADRAPVSIKLDRLRRWRRLEILGWIAAGCPDKTREKRNTKANKGNPEAERE